MLRIKLEKMYDVVLENFVHSSGRAEISREVERWISNEGNGAKLLWQDFGGFELVNNDGKVGKRIRRNLYNRTGYSLPDWLVENIGNIAQEHTLNGEYYWQLSENMNVWDHAHRKLSGNGGSCFRIDPRNPTGPVAAMMDNPDYFCSRIYDPSDGETVLSRAWAYWPGDLLWLFNSYGVSGIRLNHHSIVVATALNEPVTQGRLNSHTIYVNGQRVNVVGTENYRGSETFVDLDPGYEEYGDDGHDEYVAWDNWPD